ncbi:hypothetical protein C0Q70_12428 [Pomacea canaliculata]|uniref:Sulfatase N-terminal domain-containing protein n=1 Tax=Pomacea canaliculata TaxID=400727 RepID=A0A2T7P1J3_POMCA|nr:hypothetical protein C0Q70_12428 [Pomacea canaliculata]
MFQTPKLWLWIAVLSCHLIHRVASRTQPHVIMIMIDDQGYNERSSRNPEFRTPVMDRLESQSVRLTRMYMQPSCSMSRAAWMTGRYPHTMGIEQPFQGYDNRASNWPLRGKKSTVFEGGTLVPAFMYSRVLFPDAPRDYNGLLHVTDLPVTIINLANNSTTPVVIPNVDGKNQWLAIKQNGSSKRDKMVYQMWLDVGAEKARRIPAQISGMDPNMPGAGADWTPGWCDAANSA